MISFLAFRPQGDYAALRVFARLREMLLRCQATHIQHIQKALLLMNILLTEVLSDVMGEAGQKIIRAILAAERDGETLTKYRNGHVRASEVEITKALQGSWRDEHLFSLKVAVELYGFYAEQLVACDQQIEQQMKDLARYDLALKNANAVVANPKIPPKFDARLLLM
jgi:hypothetical protein